MVQISELDLLYLHIPFCKSKCHYCYYYSQPYSGVKQMDSYLKSLYREFDSKSQMIDSSRVGAIYIGGGSPDLLSCSQIKEIGDNLEKRGFLHKAKEITIELNPANITPEKIDALKEIGVTRISFGIQTTNFNILRRINRTLPKGDVRPLIEHAQELGIDINLDFIIGLPGYTMDDLGRDIDFFESVRPTSGFWCPLRVGTVPMTISDSNHELPLSKIESMQTMLSERLSDYNEIIPEYFSQNKEMPLYLGAAWSSRRLIGIGASAFSRDSTMITKNVNNVQLYSRLLSQGESPMMMEYNLNKKEAASLYLTERLKYDKKIDILAFNSKFGLDFMSSFDKEIRILLEEQNVRFDGDTLALTKKGCLNSQLVEIILGSFGVVVDSVFNFSSLKGSISEAFKSLLKLRCEQKGNFSYFNNEEGVKCILRRQRAKAYSRR